MQVLELEDEEAAGRGSAHVHKAREVAAQLLDKQSELKQAEAQRAATVIDIRKLILQDMQSTGSVQQAAQQMHDRMTQNLDVIEAASTKMDLKVHFQFGSDLCADQQQCAAAYAAAYTELQALSQSSVVQSAEVEDEDSDGEEEEGAHTPVPGEPHLRCLSHCVAPVATSLCY